MDAGYTYPTYTGANNFMNYWDRFFPCQNCGGHHSEIDCPYDEEKEEEEAFVKEMKQEIEDEINWEKNHKKQ